MRSVHVHHRIPHGYPDSRADTYADDLAACPERVYTFRMDEVARLLNDMVRAGLIKEYAVFGAVAQMRYTESVATLDVDILIAVPEPDVPDVLNPIYA